MTRHIAAVGAGTMVMGTQSSAAVEANCSQVIDDVAGTHERVVVTRNAAKRAIERDLPEAVAAAVVDFLFGPLAADPHRVGKPLRPELEGLWSAGRGRYRVIYAIHDDQVLVRVVRSSHRADVYRP